MAQGEVTSGFPMTDLKAQYDSTIRQLVPINGLTAEYQDQLIQRARLLELRKGTYLFRQGQRDNFSFYLLQGELAMFADGQQQASVKGGSDSARYALAQLQPRQFSVVASTSSVVLQVDRSALDKLLVFERQQYESEGTVEVSDIDEQDAGDWMTRMLQSELFAHMPTANIHQLFAALEPVEMEDGAIVVRQGDPGDYYYILREGHCEVLRRTSDGNDDIKLAELKPGDSFGEEALLSGATRNATVRMLSAGVLMRLTKEQFIELIKKPSLSEVSYTQAEQHVAQGAEWLDVRMPDEYRQSHIRGSRNLPLNELRAGQVDLLSSDRSYVLYCDSGGRSSVAAFLLTDRGFRVSFLSGGLMNCPTAVLTDSDGTTASVPSGQASSSVAEPETGRLLDADVMASAYRAEIAVANFEMEHKQPDTPGIGEAKDDAVRAELEQRMQEERARLEAARQRAEEEVAHQRKTEAKRVKQLKQAAERQLRSQKEKLEAVYASNAEEMAKLQRLKEQAQAQIRAAQEKAEAESIEARRRKEEVDQIKQELEAARADIERAAEQQRLDQVELEKKVQTEAMQKLEAERRRLAEQFQRSNEALEHAQRERAAAEAARKAAAEEAESIIAEFKLEHARTRAEEEAKLKAEREKLEQESLQIRESLNAIREAKEEAEAARRAAEDQVATLKSRLEQAEASQDEALQAQLREAEAEVQQANIELQQADHARKMAESAHQENIEDLKRQSEGELKLRAQIEEEVSSWLKDNELEAPSKEVLEQQAEHMRRIKQRSDQAKRSAQDAAQSLLDEISSQLGKK